MDGQLPAGGWWPFLIGFVFDPNLRRSERRLFSLQENHRP